MKPIKKVKKKNGGMDDFFEIDRATQEGPSHKVNKSKSRDTLKKKKDKVKNFVVEDEPVKKKRKKPKSDSLEPKEVKKEKSKKKAKDKLERVKKKAKLAESSIVDVLDKLKVDIQKHEPKDDNDYRLVYLDMFKKQRRIIKKTERKVLSRKSKGGGREIYQLSAMYSQLRETIADLRSITDLSEHADRIVELVVQPMFTKLTQDITNTFYEVKIKTKDKVQEKRVKEVMDSMDDFTISLGRKLQENYDDIVLKVRELLVGG